jgi:hypothetical protein
LFPGFNHSGVIPPYAAHNPAVSGPRSPYPTTLSTLVAQLGTSGERLQLINGLLDYREALRQAGITTGFQVVDGSFTEDCEQLRGRPPGDIDLVTFGHLPVAGPDVVAFMVANQNLFDPARTRAAFRCDAYFVDLAKDASLVVDDSFYWYGLFSHQKITHTWKGVLQVPLAADDVAARATLTAALGGGNGP